jgi:hypothetical protein
VTTRRVDVAGGVMLIERHPCNVLIDVPRGRLPIAGVAELTEVINALMDVREQLLEEGPAPVREFTNEGIGHA